MKRFKDHPFDHLRVCSLYIVDKVRFIVKKIDSIGLISSATTSVIEDEDMDLTIKNFDPNSIDDDQIERKFYNENYQ